MARKKQTARKKTSPLHWVVEPLMEITSYLEKPMFGCTAVYLHGRLCLVLASGEEPWNGLLIPTSQEHHAAIKKDFPHTVQHPVLKKWLYLPEVSEEFESDAQDIVGAVRRNDPRFGVEPQVRESRKKQKT